jgi:hypothetical protein
MPLILEEVHTPIALKAHATGERYLAWGWIRIEIHSALGRQEGTPKDFAYLQTLLNNFEFLHLSPNSNDHPSLLKLLKEHRLRSADAGHLFCLKQAKKIFPDLEFICFDKELIRAAEKEGIRIFGKD